MATKLIMRYLIDAQPDDDWKPTDAQVKAARVHALATEGADGKHNATACGLTPEKTDTRWKIIAGDRKLTCTRCEAALNPDAPRKAAAKTASKKASTVANTKAQVRKAAASSGVHPAPKAGALVGKGSKKKLASQTRGAPDPMKAWENAGTEKDPLASA